MIAHYKYDNAKTYILIEFTHGDYFRIFNSILSKKQVFNFCKSLNLSNEKIQILNSWCDL